MGRHTPEPSVVLPESVSHRRHRHLMTFGHLRAACGSLSPLRSGSRHKSIARGLKKKGETAAVPGPGVPPRSRLVFRAIVARHPRFQEALVLEEVQMPPSLDAGVMRRTKLDVISGDACESVP
jgi:hypothetical protein